MFFAIVLLLQNAVNALEDFFYQHLVAIKHGMQQRQPLGMGLGNTLVETHRGYLHQQSGLFLLIGQFEIVAHHGLNDKSPVQVIGASNGATRHQMILLASDDYRLRQLMVFCVGIERTCLSIEPHLRIGTHIDGAIQSRLQKLDVKTKLILIGPSGCVIKIEVELLDVIWLSR